MNQIPGFSQNETLFGWGTTEGIIAFELEGDQSIRVYRKTGAKPQSELQEFHPFLWLEGPELLKDFTGEFQLAELSGNLRYRNLAVFNSWKEANAARKYLAKHSGCSPTDRMAPYSFLPDPVLHRFRHP